MASSLASLHTRIYIYIYIQIQPICRTFTNRLSRITTTQHTACHRIGQPNRSNCNRYNTCMFTFIRFFLCRLVRFIVINGCRCCWDRVSYSDHTPRDTRITTSVIMDHTSHAQSDATSTTCSDSHQTLHASLN